MKPTLPPEEADTLRHLRSDGDLPALRQRVLQLSRAGWSLHAIGEPLGSPRSTVHLWVTTAAKDPHPDPEMPPPAAFDRPRVGHLKFDFPTSERATALDVPTRDRPDLATLARQARKNRGGSAPGSVYRQARHKLNERLLFYSKQGVPPSRLASLTGVTYRAMVVRLAEAREEAEE